MARKFFYVSLGILALALAFNLVTDKAEAQSGAPEFAGITSNGGFMVAITSSGDTFSRWAAPSFACDGSWNETQCPGAGWVYTGNVVNGPVPLQDSSFGNIKSKFR